MYLVRHMRGTASDLGLIVGMISSKRDSLIPAIASQNGCRYHSSKGRAYAEWVQAKNVSYLSSLTIITDMRKRRGYFGRTDML